MCGQMHTLEEMSSGHRPRTKATAFLLIAYYSLKMYRANRCLHGQTYLLHKPDELSFSPQTLE